MAKNLIQQNLCELSAELAEIMEWFEGGEVDLDEALAKYQQASQLLEQMEKYLKTAANKIKKINKA